jgi:aminoglycoside 6-adenylyltransferase
LIKAIVTWAEKEESIRALILTGSLAERGGGDELSDYDIAVFSRESRPFLRDDKVYSLIAKPWVCVREQFTWQNTTIPTRLLIFEGGVKVDFAFFPLETLSVLIKTKPLPPEFNRGYKVLLDKDSTTEQVPEATYLEERLSPPTVEEYQIVVKEFWFEIFYVAKYLKRGDLWSAKVRDWGVKEQFLLKMIRWQRREKASHPLGKHMPKWVDKSTWEDLHQCFAHFDSEDSWKALEHTCSLFRKLAIEVGQDQGYPYCFELDKNLSIYIQGLQRRCCIKHASTRGL